MSTESVRGAGRDRAGATDTTMLIWKVIAANPGITRAGIWERVEQDIPVGYAVRLQASDRARKKLAPRTPGANFSSARGFVLTDVLSKMRKRGNVTWDGDAQFRRYVASRAPGYLGNPDAIDETGTKAAQHMAIADALRVVDKRNAIVRADQQVMSLTMKQWRAVMVLADAQRAKGPPA